ncbi:MAG: EthD family reductase [Acidobacteria bacterium]|nr:MAG: ethyl tert-butyl ether degradation protein EthD [Acidobacteria bacterium 13_2_20CM_58_27]PYT76355.1 MAG: EthD family reductase [Acidobacteriota bacterium]PYT85690.1 MAG: EthD family reductase [Acidobacteriota bacterium]
MIKVTVVYPNTSGGYFDIRYYCDTHIPLVRRLLGPALEGVAVEHGIAGATPGSPAPYLAIGQLQFDSVEAFQSAFGPHSQEIMSDVPNYTNIQPVIQISEIKL